MDVSRWTQQSLGTLGTSIAHVSSSLASGLSSLTVDHTDREKVTFVTFSHLEYTSSKSNSSNLIRRPGAPSRIHQRLSSLGAGSLGPPMCSCPGEKALQGERMPLERHPCTPTQGCLRQLSAVNAVQPARSEQHCMPAPSQHRMNFQDLHQIGVWQSS